MKPTIVVPIKSHSERLRDKNFVNLGGQPLYRWTFDSLRRHADRVLIVTDDRDIRKEALHEYGFMCMGRAPEWDAGTAWEVALAATAEANERDSWAIGLALVTCPFRRPRDVEDAITMFASTHWAPIISAVRVNRKSVVLQGDGGTRMPGDGEAYISTGVIQLARRESIVEGHINRDGAEIFEVPAIVGLDIDTPLDWCAAFGAIESERREQVLEGVLP